MRWSKKMSRFNKILLSGTALLMAVSVISPVSAEEKKEASSDAGAIIFRIENIKPIADKDGLINKCNFVVTAFNRMNKGVREAKLNFQWQDNISAKYAVQGQEIKVNSKDAAKTIVSTEMTMNDIAPHSQKSFEGSVNTDKCFLLFDNLQYNVISCSNEGDKVEMRNSKIVNEENGCSNNFDYIDSKNPEYYSEFNDVPESVIAQQAEDEKVKEVEKINKDYNDIMESFKKISSTLAEIK